MDPKVKRSINKNKNKINGEISLGGGIHSLGLCLKTDRTNFLFFHSPVVLLDTRNCMKCIEMY